MDDIQKKTCIGEYFNLGYELEGDFGLEWRDFLKFFMEKLFVFIHETFAMFWKCFDYFLIHLCVAFYGKLKNLESKNFSVWGRNQISIFKVVFGDLNHLNPFFLQWGFS